MGCVSSTLTYRTEIGFRDNLRPIFFFVRFGSDQPDRVDIPSALRSFPSGGEEGRVQVGVDGMDLDVFRPDSALFEDPSVCLEQVDMMAAGHGAAISRALE